MGKWWLPISNGIFAYSDPKNIDHIILGFKNLIFAYDQLRMGLQNQFNKGIDGFNIADSFAGDGLRYTYFDPVNNPVDSPRKLINILADTTQSTLFTLQNDSNGVFRGINLEADTTDTTNGGFFLKDFWDTTLPKRILLSLLPDASSGSNPGATIRAPLGILTLDTGVAQNIIIKRNGTTQVTIDGTQILGAVKYVAPTFTSSVAIGTAPLTVTSTTVVTNLNADLLDGYHSSSFVFLGSALTNNTVPRANSSGQLIDSGVTDDGTTLTTSRVTFSGNSNFTIRPGVGNSLTLQYGNGLSYADFISIGTDGIATAKSTWDFNSSTMQVKRGLIASVPANLSAGQIYAPSDAPEVVIGL